MKDFNSEIEKEIERRVKEIVGKTEWLHKCKNGQIRPYAQVFCSMCREGVDVGIDEEYILKLGYAKGMIGKDKRGQYLCKHIKEDILDADCVWCNLTIAELGLKSGRERILIYEKALKKLSTLGGTTSDGNKIAQEALDEGKFKPSNYCKCEMKDSDGQGNCTNCGEVINFKPQLLEISKLDLTGLFGKARDVRSKINELVDEVNKLKRMIKNDN